jgi:hypothetical protein
MHDSLVLPTTQRLGENAIKTVAVRAFGPSNGFALMVISVRLERYTLQVACMRHPRTTWQAAPDNLMKSTKSNFGTGWINHTCHRDGRTFL